MLIDEGSTDNSAEIMSLYKNNSKIHLHNTNNIGLPEVANFAISKAEGKYIIRLDADDVFDENILLVLSNYLERNPKVALIFPDYFLMDEQGFVYAQERRQPIYYANHMLDAPPNGACTMIKKEVLQQVGGYRSDLGAQDGLDLWSKVRNQYKSANINIPLFYYRRHGNNLTGNREFILNARRKIKRDSVADIEKYKPIIAIILCRENYDFTPNLWSQKVSGKLLLDIAVERCIKSDIFDFIVVSSDATEVKRHIEKYSDSRIVFNQRSPESTIRSRPVAHTIEDIVVKYDSDFSGISVLSILQAPLITTGTMEEVVSSLMFNDADSSILVKEVNSSLFERTSHGLMQINYKGFMMSDFDTLYLDTKTCVAVKNSVISKGSLTGSSIVSTVAPNEEFFYINSKQDLSISSFLYGEK